MSQKKFDNWNKIKKATQQNKKTLYFHPREIWFVRLGKNIGFEQDGKGNDFLRPVIVLRKFNQQVFWSISLTTNLKKGKYYFEIENSGRKKASAILSQIRLIDTKRLRYKIGDVDKQTFQQLKKAISEILLSSDD
jgi:mRNA interferase MazF